MLKWESEGHFNVAPQNTGLTPHHLTPSTLALGFHLARHSRPIDQNPDPRPCRLPRNFGGARWVGVRRENVPFENTSMAFIFTAVHCRWGGGAGAEKKNKWSKLALGKKWWFGNSGRKSLKRANVPNTGTGDRKLAWANWRDKIPPFPKLFKFLATPNLILRC